MPIDLKRYAMYSHPWTNDREGRTEVSCLECRKDDLPIVIWEGTRSSLFYVLAAVDAHEKETHSRRRKAVAAAVAV